MSGAAAQIHITRITRLVDLQEVNQPCWLLEEVELELARMLLDLFAYQLISLDVIR